MKRRKIIFAVGVFCLLLVSIAVYEILLVSGFIRNKDTISESKLLPGNQSSIKQAAKDNNVGIKKVTLTWDSVPNAASYNVYWSNTKGVTRRNANKISAIKNSATIAGLKRGATYYFVVTAVNELGESRESEEMEYLVE